MYACNNGQNEIVDYLMGQGASLEHDENTMKTPLMLAVGGGNLDTVKTIAARSDLEAEDHRGWTALFYAVLFGRENCAEYLLKIGANPLAV